MEEVCGVLQRVKRVEWWKEENNGLASGRRMGNCKSGPCGRMAVRQKARVSNWPYGKSSAKVSPWTQVNTCLGRREQNTIQLSLMYLYWITSRLRLFRSLPEATVAQEVGVDTLPLQV